MQKESQNQLKNVVNSSQYVRYAIMIVSVYGTVQGLTMFWEKHKISWISQDTITVAILVSFCFAFLLEWALMQAEKGMGYVEKGSAVRKSVMALWGFYAFINFLTMSANIMTRADNVAIASPVLESAISVRESFQNSLEQMDREYQEKLKELTKYRSGAVEAAAKSAFDEKKQKQIDSIKEKLSGEIAKIEAKLKKDIAIYRSRDYDGEAQIRANVRWVKRKALAKEDKARRAAQSKIAKIETSSPKLRRVYEKTSSLEADVKNLTRSKIATAKELETANLKVFAIERKLKNEKEHDLFLNKLYTFLFAFGVVVMNIFMSFNVGRIQGAVEGKKYVKEEKEIKAVMASEVSHDLPVENISLEKVFLGAPVLSDEQIKDLVFDAMMEYAIERNFHKRDDLESGSLNLVFGRDPIRTKMKDKADEKGVEFKIGNSKLSKIISSQKPLVLRELIRENRRVLDVA